jgi:hypothetical protein
MCNRTAVVNGFGVGWWIVSLRMGGLTLCDYRFITTHF